MNKQGRLSRAEQQAAARQPAASEYRLEAEARIVKRLTEALTEHGGPEGLRVWLEGLQARRGPSRLGVDWNELNEKVMRFACLLWRDLHGSQDEDTGKSAEAG